MSHAAWDIHVPSTASEYAVGLKMFARFLLLTLVWYDNTAEENKRFLSAYLRFEGAFYLSADKSQIIQILNVFPSNLSCVLRCVAETSCLSVNVAAVPNSSDGRFVCELLTTNISNKKDRLQPSGNFHHFSKYVSWNILRLKLCYWNSHTSL